MNRSTSSVSTPWRNSLSAMWPTRSASSVKGVVEHRAVAGVIDRCPRELRGGVLPGGVRVQGPGGGVEVERLVGGARHRPGVGRDDLVLEPALVDLQPDGGHVVHRGDVALAEAGL